MCRLLLMNVSAFDRIDPHLEALLHSLMVAFGGHGNGVGALWPNGTTRISKSVKDDAMRSAALLRRFRERGASWFLFHTRSASVGAITQCNCHPFRMKQGKLVMAHNGHDERFANFGSLLGITDSECLARTLVALSLPPDALLSARGVFVGFHNGTPFVAKGGRYTDLVALWSSDGALLFVSELPDEASWYEPFEFVTPLGYFLGTTEEELFESLLASPFSRPTWADPLPSSRFAWSAARGVPSSLWRNEQRAPSEWERQPIPFSSSEPCTLAGNKS